MLLSPSSIIWHAVQRTGPSVRGRPGSAGIWLRPTIEDQCRQARTRPFTYFLGAMQICIARTSYGNVSGWVGGWLGGCLS